MAPAGRNKFRRSSVVEAHDVYLKYHRHDLGQETESKKQGIDPDSKIDSTVQPDRFAQFHRVEKTGVIYATSRAASRGYHPDDTTWANMGQGAPETGPIESAPNRSFSLHIEDSELEYAPVTGLKELREKVAHYYNHLYRQGKPSQYEAENVCIVPGGRAGLTRIMASLGNVQIGYFTPDYTAYEQALGLFLRIAPSPLVHRDVNEAIMEPDEFDFQCSGRGVGAILMSNPVNPTGQSIEGERLAKYVETARRQQCALIMDEFYSHYYYDGDAVDPADGGVDDNSNWPKTVSSASYIEDVNSDPILIVNGLTKNWRCPGFRVCWIVAPKHIINMVGSAGSFLDGGANAPLQHLALPLMDLDFIRRDAWALQRHFREKRDYLLKHLAEMGITVKWKPNATFYVWADISSLPPPLDDCLVFLEECTKHKVIVVPGVFFDINPRGVRNVPMSKCISMVRFSYGPPKENLVRGMKAIREIIEEWKQHPEAPGTYEQNDYDS